IPVVALAPGLAADRRALPDGGQLRHAGRVGRRAGGVDLWGGACGRREAGSGGDEMGAAPRRLDVDWLRDSALATLLALLDSDGEEARVVGGAVRNSLLAEPVGDIDMATTATPDEVIARVEAAGFKAVATGIQHGPVTVVAEGRPHQVPTLRGDVETHRRPAKVVFRRH